MHGAKMVPQSQKHQNRRRSSPGTAAVNEASNLRVASIRFGSRLIAQEMGVDRCRLGDGESSWPVPIFNAERTDDGQEYPIVAHARERGHEKRWC